MQLNGCMDQHYYAMQSMLLVLCRSGGEGVCQLCNKKALYVWREQPVWRILTFGSSVCSVVTIQADHDAHCRPQTWHTKVSMFDEGWVVIRLSLFGIRTQRCQCLMKAGWYSAWVSLVSGHKGVNVWWRLGGIPPESLRYQDTKVSMFDEGWVVFRLSLFGIRTLHVFSLESCREHSLSLFPQSFAWYAVTSVLPWACPYTSISFIVIPVFGDRRPVRRRKQTNEVVHAWYGVRCHFLGSAVGPRCLVSCIATWC